MYIINDQARTALYQEPAFTAAFTAARRMDIIICGLGTRQSINSIPAWAENTDRIFPGVDLGKSAGVAFGRPYDLHGRFLVSPENDKTLSIPLDQIMRVPRRLAIVQRKSKFHAARGALEGKLFTDMILTESVALRITDALGI